MSALNAILLVGFIFAAKRAQGSGKCKNYGEDNCYLKKNERKGLLNHLEKRLYCELKV